MLASGLNLDATRATLDRVLENQSVMLSTNQLFLLIAVVLFAAACTIWLAPKPNRVADASAAH